MKVSYKPSPGGLVWCGSQLVGINYETVFLNLEYPVYDYYTGYMEPGRIKGCKLIPYRDAPMEYERKSNGPLNP